MQSLTLDDSVLAMVPAQAVSLSLVDSKSAYAVIMVRASKDMHCYTG
jgi:hypothetical protein